MQRAPDGQSALVSQNVLQPLQPFQQKVSPSVVALQRQKGPASQLPQEMSTNGLQDQVQVGFGEAATAAPLAMESTAGADQATAAPAPNRFNAERLEIPLVSSISNSSATLSTPTGPAEAHARHPVRLSGTSRFAHTSFA
jgi:hypothetical protein